MQRNRKHERDRSLERQLKGYRLSTAEITYHMPDHPGLLQIFIWQHYDIAPKFPELRKFLDFWRDNLDGPLHSVRVAHAELLTPGRARFVQAVYTLQ